ncbi:MAG TPA: HEAT repeat domain-containing protein [Vicinamibacterales bacterium]|nr:HEAT repeat domain-containing protein [Vicinamibacterales bacterium]
MRALALALCCLALWQPAGRGQAGQPPASQKPQAPEPQAAVTAAQVQAAIDQLGSVEFPVRSSAARTVRRADAAIAVPALLQAVKQHKDEYVRFRALVVLSGFNDPRMRDVMVSAIADKNDRMRTVAYGYFERNPDKSIVPRLLQQLKVEQSEFVRPALTRALAAHGDDPAVRPVMEGLVMQGQAFFRSVVIEALGDHRAAYALKPIVEVAKTEGPLQDDAALALGKIGDKSVLPVLAALQRTAPRESQPSVAAAICLLGVNCASHQTYIVESLRFSIAKVGFQSLLRSSASALAMLAVAGREDALAELVTQGATTEDPVRAPIVLAVGTVALRNTPLLLKALEKEPLRAPAIDLLREAFDMLEEDFEEERFFATVRRNYWQSPAGSAPRAVADTLVRKLEF